MNKEDLQNRIITINKDLINMRANVLKLEGHLSEANHWLASIFKMEMTNENNASAEIVPIREAGNDEVNIQSTE